MNKLTLTTGLPNPAFLRFGSNGGRLLLWRSSSSSLTASSSSSSTPPVLLGFDGVVQEQGNRMRLDSWLSLQLPDHISRARVQNSIRTGLAYVNDQLVNKVDVWSFILGFLFIILLILLCEGNPSEFYL